MCCVVVCPCRENLIICVHTYTVLNRRDGNGQLLFIDYVWGGRWCVRVCGHLLRGGVNAKWNVKSPRNGGVTLQDHV